MSNNQSLCAIIISVVLMALGIAAGLYVGIWLMLIGGIVQVIEGVKANPVDSWEIAKGVARAFFAGPTGGLVAGVPLLIAQYILKKI